MTEKTAIIAHDAGAANHIIHWLMSEEITASAERVIFQGPAKNLAERLQVPFENQPLNGILDDSDCLIAGSGWATDVEKEAIRLAIKKNKKTICVIDHWTNFKQRLTYQGHVLQVDEIWVTDSYAKEIAKNAFPNIHVLQKNNTYLEQAKAAIAKNASKMQLNRLLFIMEPIRQPWFKGQSEPGECIAFKLFMDNRRFITPSNDLNIVIRPHPSDAEGKYQALQKAFSSENIEISKNIDLFTDIAQSNVVLGIQSYALIIALEAGKKVISCLPPSTPPCVLPHERLIHLREFIE